MKRQSSKSGPQDSILSSPAPENMLRYLSPNCYVIGSDHYLWPYTLYRRLACKSAPSVLCCLSGFLHSVLSPLTPVLKLLCMSCTQLTLGQEDSPGGPNLIPRAPLKAQGESERSASRGRFQALLLTLQMEGPCDEEGRWPRGTEGGPQTTASKEMGASVLRLRGTGFCQQPEGAWEQILLLCLQK